MQMELDRFQYGNCDISDWEGLLNIDNDNRARNRRQYCRGCLVRWIRGWAGGKDLL